LSFLFFSFLFFSFLFFSFLDMQDREASSFSSLHSLTASSFHIFVFLPFLAKVQDA